MLTRDEIFDVDPRFNHLVNFVDRTLEFGKFQNVAEIPLRKRTCNFLAFYGSPGIGKSWLINRLHYECKRRNLAVAGLQLDDDRLSDPVRIMLKLVEQLGDTEFPTWGAVKREWNTISGFIPDSRQDPTGNSTLNVTSTRDAIFEKDVVAGNKFETHYQFSGDVKTPAQQNPEDYKHALTQSFLRDLAELLQQKTVIFLLDNFDTETITHRTREWIMENLLDKPRSARGHGILVVLTASRELDSSLYFDVLQADTEFQEIHPLGREHIIEYLKIKQVPEETIQKTIDVLLQRTHGIPKRVSEDTGLVLKVLNKFANKNKGVS